MEVTNIEQFFNCFAFVFATYRVSFRTESLSFHYSLFAPLAVSSFLRLVEFDWNELARKSLGIASLATLDVEVVSLGCLISFQTMVRILY